MSNDFEPFYELKKQLHLILGNAIESVRARPCR